jgi:hypothetical protein
VKNVIEFPIPYLTLQQRRAMALQEVFFSLNTALLDQEIFLTMDEAVVIDEILHNAAFREEAIR